MRHYGFWQSAAASENWPACGQRWGVMRFGPEGVDRPGSCLDRPGAGWANANEDGLDNGRRPRSARYWKPGSESGTSSLGKQCEARGNAKNAQERPAVSPDFSETGTAAIGSKIQSPIDKSAQV